MIASDEDLGARRRAMESGERIRDPRRSTRRSVIPVAAVSLLIGAVLGAGAGYATAANVVVRTDVQQAESAFNKGQPLYCSGIEDLPLREASQWLRDRGYTVTWQLERFPGEPQISETPPDEGVIVNGGMVDARTIAMVVVPSGSPEKHVSVCP